MLENVSIGEPHPASSGPYKRNSIRPSAVGFTSPESVAWSDSDPAPSRIVGDACVSIDGCAGVIVVRDEPPALPGAPGLLGPTSTTVAPADWSV